MAGGSRRLVGTAGRGGALEPVCTLHLLDGFRIVESGRPVHLPSSAERVAAFLAVRGIPLRRSYVAGKLWADSSEERAAANLRSALWRLRRPGFSLVEATTTEVWIGRAVDVDLHAAVETAHGIIDGRLRAGAREAARALRLLGSDLLVDRWDDDWVAVERESFHQLRLHALDRLCGQLVDTGALEAAVQVGLVAVDGEPLRESAQRALIRAYAAEGNPAEAIRQYQRCRKLLADELGVPPSPATEELMVLLSSPGAVAS